MIRLRMSERVKNIENRLNIGDSGVLIIDENKDGTYGEDSLTEAELENYAKEHKYSCVIIDDIINSYT